MEKTKNKRFLFHAVGIIFVCFFMQYFYSCLPGDNLNVLQTYLPELRGWTPLQITTPVTIGALLAVPGTLLFGTVIVKKGPNFVIIPSIILMAVCQAAIAVTDNLLVYSVAMCLIRLLIQIISLGMTTLIANWFVSWRGRALGIITIGSQFNTATSVALLTKGCDALGFRTSYLILSGAIAVLAILTMLLSRDNPSAFGLDPDGAEQEQLITASNVNSEEVWPLKQIFAAWGTWVLIIGMGFLTFIIKAIMPNFMPRMLAVGFSKNLTLMLLTVATVCGMPLSYLFGWLNDRYGAPKACITLGFAYIMTVLSFRFAHPGMEWLLFFAVLGIGCITGGTASLYPALAMHIYGQAHFAHVNRYVMTIQNIIVAFAVSFMSAIQTATGSLNGAFDVLLIMAVFATGLLFTVRQKHNG